MDVKNKLSLVSYYFKKYGFFKTIKKIFSALYKRIFKINLFEYNEEEYQKWISNNEPTKEQIEIQKEYKFEYNPKISVVVPMYNTKKEDFEELVECMINQTYTNWELCLADGGSKEKNEYFEKIINKDSRIVYKLLDENKGIADNSNEALKMVTGDYIALLDHDDLLPIFCLFEIVKTINENPDVEFIYTDEDKIIEHTNKRVQAYFKPDFQIDSLRSNNYITHLSVFKKDLMDKIKGFDGEYNGAQDFDIILRAVENTKNIIHIPKILYHWRISPNSTAVLADSKPYAFEAGRKAVEDHLKRCGLDARVYQSDDIKGVYEVRYNVKNNPKVSIIINSINEVKYLKKEIKAIIKTINYDNYEIIIVSNKNNYNYICNLYKNNSIIKVYEFDGGYIESINYGIEKVNSDYIIELSDTIKPISLDWIIILLGYIQRDDVGLVGARIYNKDLSLRHAGLDLDKNSNLLINTYENTPKNKHAYFGKECITRNVDGVTKDCMCFRKKDFEDIYLNSKIKDVDEFCNKIRQNNYLIVYNAYVEFKDLK